MVTLIKMAIEKSQHKIESFLEELAAFKSLRVFNPWATNCEHADVENSFYVRRNNLRSVMNACTNADAVDVWVGRDLGWRGGRRTGVALVDELTLSKYAKSIGASGISKATAGPVMKERTAAEIHLAQTRVSKKVFYWNVFPFHPHCADSPQSNRSHTRTERDKGLSFLEKVLEILPVERVIAIGNDASRAMRSINVACSSVRHPSYGGQRQFHRQLDAHYGIPTDESSQKTFFVAD